MQIRSCGCVCARRLNNDQRQRSAIRIERDKFTSETAFRRKGRGETKRKKGREKEKEKEKAIKPYSFVGRHICESFVRTLCEGLVRLKKGGKKANVFDMFERSKKISREEIASVARGNIIKRI